MKRPLNYTCLEKLFSYLTLYRRKNITTSATCFVLSIPAYHWRFNILKKSRHIGWADDSLKKKEGPSKPTKALVWFLASLTCQHTHNSEATCCHDLTRRWTWRTPAVTEWRRTVLRAINVTSQQHGRHRKAEISLILSLLAGVFQAVRTDGSRVSDITWMLVGWCVRCFTQNALYNTNTSP